MTAARPAGGARHKETTRRPQPPTGSTTERFPESSGGRVSREKAAGKDFILVLFQRSWKEATNPPKPQEVTFLLLRATF